MKLCECGCGQPIGTPKRVRQPRRFLPGHYSKTEAHRDRMAAIDPALTKHVGEENGNWRGGRRIDAMGYVVVRTGPNTEEREHRLVAETMLGRPLAPGEVVHHKNADRSDNRPENLEVLASQGDHMREHMTTEEARRRGKLGNDARYGRAALKASESTPPPSVSKNHTSEAV